MEIYSENNVTVMETWRDVTVSWRDVTNFDTPLQAVGVTLLAVTVTVSVIVTFSFTVSVT